MVIGQKDIFSGSFGIITLYLNYVKCGFFFYGNYAYTRFEELCTRSGEVLFTREHKATLSKEKSLRYIDIDELKIFRNMYSKDEMVLKTKKK